MRAIRLRTEYRKDPLGIDERNPRLTWNCGDGKKQRAYRVFCREGADVLYDSGRVDSDDMYCVYQGQKLCSRQHVTWQVCLWDGSGKETWSEEAFWEMGLLEEEDWSGTWICGVDTEGERRLPADCYLREISCDQPVEKVRRGRLYITALGVYDAVLNGERLPGVLAPGCSQYDRHLYYQTYDVTELLCQENRLEIQVGDGWLKGKIGSSMSEYVHGTQTRLLAQLEIVYADGTMQVVGTDGDFRWSNDGPVRFADLMDGETYDARREPSYAYHAMPAAEERRIPTASKGLSMEEHETFTPVLEISPSGQKILDFGQNLAGYVKFRVRGTKGQTIRLHLFEMKDHGEYSVRSLEREEDGGTKDHVRQCITFICSGGEDVFEPKFFYSGFQYALVEGIDDVRPEDFRAVAVYSSLDFEGSFSCSNEKINRFVQNTIWSQKSNFVDIPTDCPHREKSGWTGDAQVFVKTACCFADTSAFYRKWLQDVRDCQEESGRVMDVNPKIRRPSRRDAVNGSAGWADAAVIIPYTLWKLYGDDWRKCSRRWGRHRRPGSAGSMHGVRSKLTGTIL